MSAVNDVGEGPRTAEVFATPVPAPESPKAPGNLEAAAGDSQVILTWEEPFDGFSPIVKYKI